MNTNAIAIPTTGQDLGSIQHRWGDLGEIELREQARAASEALDSEALWALTVWHLTTSGRKGDAVSPRTLENYARGVRDLVHWCREHNRVPHRLRASDAGLYRSWLQRQGGSVAGSQAREPEPYSQPLAPATVNLRLAAARRLMGALLATEAKRGGDPFAGLGVTDPTPRHEKRQGYSEAEWGRLVAAASAPRANALLHLAGEAGLRASELASLRWGDCDLPGRTLSVIGKGRKLRHVPISSRAREAMAALWEADGRPAKSARVLGVGRQRVHGLVTELAQQAQVPTRGVHSLRHRAGTAWYRLLRDLVEVARIMGHSDPSTARIYVHATAAGDLLELADRLGERRVA